MIPLVLLLALQDPQIEGEFWTAYHLTEGSLVGAQGALLTGIPAAAAPRSVDRFTGRVRVRLEVRPEEKIRGMIELETRSRDMGLLLGFGRDDNLGDDEIDVAIEQAFIEVQDFLFEGAALRFGVQDLRYSLRPHGEAALLDVTESESAFAGVNTAGTALRNTFFPDTLEPAGLIYRIDAREGYRLDLIAVKVLDNASGTDAGGAPTRDESIYGLYFDAIPDPERAKIFATLVVFRGGIKGANVWTFGAGVDAYLGDDKQFEFFAEAYLQFGDFNSTIGKDAWAAVGGARWVEPLEGSVFSCELRWLHYSGDRSPSDGNDEAFQSYESMSRLAILQSDEWGLDFDTNVRVISITMGLGAIELGEGRLDLAVDAGMARLDRVFRGPAGVVVTPRKDLGMEIELEAVWKYCRSLDFFLTAAWLVGSDWLDAVTGEDSGSLLVLGGRLNW